MSENLKKLTGKNPKDFEPVAYSLINMPDVDLFKELVDKEDYLYDFIKQNVSKRLEKVCNKDNYRNLLQLLKYYSPSYEDFIISVLVKYANEDLTDSMLDLIENGNEDEKTYCAKYFSFIKDPLAIEYLKDNAYSENSYLSSNSISALSSFGEREIYNEAIAKLKSDDEFEQLSGAKFLVSYGDKSAYNAIIETIKTSSFAEHIATELPYLINLKEIIGSDKTNGLFILNNIINGLGEVSALSQVFDFELYEILENLIKGSITSEIAVVLLNAIDKFETLTENDEYLFDETKDTKQEIYDIKNLLSELNKNELIKLTDEELNQDSLFVFNALEFSQNIQKMRELLNSNNQTILLKTVEILKTHGVLSADDKNIALEKVSNEDIKNIILAI